MNIQVFLLNRLKVVRNKLKWSEKERKMYRRKKVELQKELVTYKKQLRKLKEEKELLQKELMNLRNEKTVEEVRQFRRNNIVLSFFQRLQSLEAEIKRWIANGSGYGQ